MTATEDEDYPSSDKPLQGTIPGVVTLATGESRLRYRSCPAAETDAEDGQRANGIPSVDTPALSDNTSPSVLPSPDTLQNVSTYSTVADRALHHTRLGRPAISRCPPKYPRHS